MFRLPGPPILLLILVPATTPAGDGFAAFFGQPEQTGSVQHVVPGQPSTGPAALQGIELLPIDFSARTTLHTFTPGRPRLRNDVPGAGRVELPGGQGSLYRYSRAEGASGVVAYGFFVVDAAGMPQVVHEFAGTGGALDPFVDPVAIAPGGDAVLLATTPAAGGDLIEVDLVTGVARNRTTSLAPLDFDGAGLALASSWGTAVASTGILRFDRQTAGDAQWVPLSTAPSGGGGAATSTRLDEDSPAPAAAAWFARQVVLSANGSFAATIAGADPSLAHVYVYSLSTGAGGAVRVSKAPGALSGAGFLPQDEDGPFLALSDDGSHCAWLVETPVSRELYMASVQPLPGGAPVHVTQDVCFDPFLDEVGQFLFFGAKKLLIVIGDQTGETFLHQFADIYEIELGPPGQVPIMRNLSETSGDLAPPFSAYGTLEPRGVYWIPDRSGFLLADDYGMGGLRSVLLGATGTTTVLPGLESLDGIERVASHFVVIGEVETPQADATQMHTLADDLVSPTSLVFDLAVEASSFSQASGPAGGLSFVATDDGLGYLGRTHPATGTLELASPTPTTYGAAVAVTTAGETIGSLGAEDADALFLVWSMGSSTFATVPAGSPAFVLPGS